MEKISLLRGAFCTIWIAAFILTIENFMYASECDTGGPDQITFMLRTIVCLSVGVAAAIAHYYLFKHQTMKE